jgi:two-component system, NtrC family, response regulator HydG
MESRSEKILLVDDNRKHLQNIARFLRSEGYDVDEAQDGDEATQHLKERSYDLLVSDLVMPGANGFRLLERKRHVAPNTPALIMSSFPDINLPELMEAGAVDFIAKPLELDDLLNKVKKALSNSFEF